MNKIVEAIKNILYGMILVVIISMPILSVAWVLSYYNMSVYVIFVAVALLFALHQIGTLVRWSLETTKLTKESTDVL